MILPKTGKDFCHRGGKFSVKVEKMSLRQSKSQLRIEGDIVIPGKPVAGVQLTVRQGHHFRETGGDVIDFIYHSFRGNNVMIAHDFYRAAVHARETPARAFSYCERK